MKGSICPLDYRYGRNEMKAIFSEESRILYRMKVEAALAKANASLGIIGKNDADEIARVASLDIVKMSRIKEIEKEINHDTMAMVRAMTEQCRGDAGKYVHLGATSNDIIDTATALQIKDALEIIQQDMDELLCTLAKIAKRERNTLEVGRTHAQFAIPITFGFKMAGYIAEVLRHRERLFEIIPRACAGKMAGAVGTGAALGKNFVKIQILTMQELSLTYEPAATQVVGRDRYTELICLLANIATSLERYSTEIRNLQRTEIGEVSEMFDAERQVGSSTMAQKRNPINSENITGLARIIRGFVIPTFENQVLWHERDLSNSSAERFTIPHVFVLLDEMLVKMDKIFAGLEINADRMRKNIELSRGLIMAEPVMMKLVEKGIGRQDAHEILRDASMTAIERDVDLKDVLLERDDIRGVLSVKEITSVMDPENYTGSAKDITDKMVLAAEEALGRKV
ncbi:fumarate hydratase class II [Candidatus Methanoplasma termitum]|uniref:Adenylosuccinate lyase n=1 Tax=Candidatus Methanoplasma termitum TaxID=1577791 RepID=A0A0A7LFV8_9ARCH|nr:adenylosuccinate lyase [Candidatus Methanoplasma termitum]AIZ56391.1 fumarate hydratase class II [Candidatus Methanoplasma termitum]